ncbi:sensor histidine kinase [Gorillibacterium sp. sgz5001074]|uniref:sensor histidine kinase n=1 Tax=Gorillibacterium sp. sgz5001074 TaxID=3446695 RepID=UPI003F67006E
MNFILMSIIAIVPLALGVSIITLFGKSKFTFSIVLFLLCISIWQLDVSVLYSSSLFSTSTIEFLFRLFRIGSVMLPPVFFYVGYVAFWESSAGKENCLIRLLMNRYAVILYFAWSLVVYVLNWTQGNFSHLKAVLSTDGVTVMYPVYGPYAGLFNWHIRLIIFSIVVAFAVSFKIKERHLKHFFVFFIISYFVTYMVGLLNLKISTFVFSGQVAVMIFSLLNFMVYIHMHRNLTKEMNTIQLRKTNTENLEFTTSGLIHELKNPLSIIKGFSEILPRSQQLNPTSAEMVENITMASNHLHSVILNFTDFIKSGKLSITDTDLNEVLKETISMAGLKASEKDILLQLKNHTRASSIPADKDKLRQVIINLIHNGIDAIPEGNPRRLIQLELFEENNNYCIHIEDSGDGIPEHIRANMFTPFETTKPGGMGLGLSISLRIVNSHGGTIDLLRTGANGTLFKISLPKHHHYSI